MLPDNPTNYVPSAVSDNVYILSGRDITISSGSKTIGKLTINGTLDFATTTGHSFTEIRGSGKILLAADNFPAGDVTHFITKDLGEGTVVYYGTGYTLTTARTFYHMEVKMDNAADILTLRTNYTINGDLTLTTGVFRINDASATALNLTIKGTTLVKTGNSFTVGNGNTVHTITFEGDITNNGTIDFANDAQYSCAANGAVKAVFSGASNNTLTCNGTTDFYRLFVEKGTDETYILSVISTNTANFRLFGPVAGGSCLDAGAAGWENLALVLRKGTLKLGSNINIPALGKNRSGTASPYEFHIPSGARLWINGASVATSDDGGGWRGITVFGTLQVSAGTFTNPANTGGITYFSNPETPGTLLLEGGTIYTTQLKQANTGGKFNYIQTGGLFYINALSDSRGSSAVFALPESDFTFQMSGGTVRIDAVNTTATNGIHIGCDPANISVTGGTFDLRIPTLGVTGQPEFEINSTAPLYNLTITNSGFAGTQEVALQNNLEVYNLTIGANTQFDARGYDLSVHGNFTLENTGVFQHNNNTTYFTGSLNTSIIIENTNIAGVLDFYILNINKDGDQIVSIAECGTRSVNPADALNTIIDIENDLTITRGNFRIERYTVTLPGNLSIADGNLLYNPNLPGRLKLNGTSAQTITGSAIFSPVFGNLELNNSSGASITTDITAKNFILTAGILSIGTYRFTVDTNFIENGNAVAFGSSKMIMTAADHGARGLRFKMDGSYTGNTVTFPVGSGGNWTKLDVVTGSVGTISGFLTVTPVALSHPNRPGGGCDAIDGYWKTRSSGLGGITTGVEYRFWSPYSISGGGDFEYYLINGTWNSSGGATTPGTLIFESANLNGFPTEADFTVGKNNCFNNTNEIYSTQSGFWDVGSTWVGGTVPATYDYAYIRNGHTVTVRRNNADDAGKVTIESGGTLDVGTYTGLSYNIVKGGGTLRIASNNLPAADYFEFMYNDSALVEYYGAAFALPTGYSVYPNLKISGTGNKSLPDHDVLVRRNLYIDGQTLILNDADDLTVNDSIIFNNAGILQYPAGAGSCKVTVNKSIDLSGNSAANTIQVEAGGSYTNNHILEVRDNIIVTSNAAITLFRNSGNKAADLYFIGGGNSTVNNDGAASNNIELNRLIINKSVSSAEVNFLEEFNLNGLTNGASNTKALYLQTGRLTLDNSYIDIDLNTGGGNFEIPSTASLTVRNGIVNVSGANTGIMLDGLMHVGDNSQWLINGGTNNYIEYGASGNAEIQVDNGTLRIGSHLRRLANSETGVLKFYQNSSSSTVVIGENDAPTGSRGVFEVLNAGSVFSQADNASITIVRQQTAPSVASLYFNPASSGIGQGAGFVFGNASTPASQVIGIYSTVELQNITVNNSSGNNPVLRQWTVPLTLNGDLTIQSGATYDAYGLDLVLNGNLINSGTFTSNYNTTYFSGTIDQTITGNTTFYNLIKTSSTDLELSTGTTNITVANNFDMQSGMLTDNSNSFSIQGNCNFDGKHLYGGSGNGLTFNGTIEQELTGKGTFGKLTINNPNNVIVPLGNNLTIDSALNLQSGIFNIGKNLLTIGLDAVVEGAPFSTSNMIQTNLSFTDYGIRKYLPAGSSTFVYPIGSGGKYTPVTLNISGNSNGYITVTAANEMHPSIIEDSEAPSPEIVDKDNVLQYHWVLRSSGISGFSGEITMKYTPTDVKVTAPYTVYEYITARLLNDGSGNWNKYDNIDKFDEINEILIFDFAGVDDSGISGDYTAGVDGSTFHGAIPDQVPIYETNNSGYWTTGTIWTPNIAGGPRGAMTRINAGHTVTSVANGILNYTTQINGTVRLDSTFAHRFGEVTGTGRVYTKRDAIPAGFYDNFFSATGGTLEYGGSANYSVMSGISTVNNLVLSGSGERRFPNDNILLNGDMEINGEAGLSVINSFNQNIEIKGDLIKISGNFNAGTGATAAVEFSSVVTQNITGDFTGSNNLNILEINNVNSVVLSGDVDVERALILTAGALTTGANNLTLGLNATVSPALGTSTRYVNGELTKALTGSSDFIYPIGKNGHLGTIELLGVTGFSGTGNWAAEYYFTSPVSYDSYASPINYVSHTEYWSIQAPAGGSSNLRITLDGSSDVANAITDLADLRFVGWNGSQWELVGGTPAVSGTAVSGTITTGTAINFDTYQYITLGSIQMITLATASFVSGDVTICEGFSTDIIVSLTGTPNWSYTYTDGTTPVTVSGVTTTSDTIRVSPSSTTTYTLTAVSDNGGAGILVGITSVVVTVNSKPTVTFTNNSTANTICDGTPVTFTAGGGANYNFHINSITVQNSAVTTYNNSTLADQDEIFVVVTGSNGCRDTSSATTITVNEFPVGTLVSDDADNTICYGTEVTFTATGGTNYRFMVDGSTAQNSASATYTTSSLTDGNELTVEVTNTFGCSAIYPGIIMTVNALPLVDLGADFILCVDSSAILDAGAGMADYLWSTAETTQTITVNSAGTYYVDVTDMNGCTNSDTISVSINPMSITAVITNASCNGYSDGEIDITVSGGNLPVAGYLWSNGETTQDLTGIAAGNYTVTVTDARGCILDSAYTVTQPAEVVPSLSGSDAICQNTIVVYTTEAGMSNYAWVVTNIDPTANHTVTAGGGAANNSITIQWVGYEDHTVSVSYTDGSGCTALSPTVLNIRVHKLPEPGPAHHIPNEFNP